MARTRLIKPTFFTNENLAECSLSARLFFIGLWQHADYRGVLEWRPKRLKAAILPYDEADVVKLLAELVKRDFVQRFEHGGKDYLFMPTFEKHQHPHKKERDAGTENPDPDALELRPASAGLRTFSGANQDKTRSGSGAGPVRNGTSPADTDTDTDTDPDTEKGGTAAGGSAAAATAPRLDEVFLDPTDFKPFQFPCLRTKEFPTGVTFIPVGKMREWDTTYGRKFNIVDDIRNCRQWVMDNPNRRKHPGRNTISMIGNWLRRTDRNGSGKPPLTQQERRELKQRMDAARAADLAQAQRERRSAHRGGDSNGAPVSIGDLLGEFTGGGTDCDAGK